MDTKKYPPRDDSLLHQIRHVTTSRPGGLGVAVTCVCMQGEIIGDRNIESNEDSWMLYHDHLAQGVLNETV